MTVNNTTRKGEKMTSEKPTQWHFEGVFFSGDTDKAGTPIGDICSGYFVTAGSDESKAREAIIKRYEDNSGRFELRRLVACWDEKAAARIFKRGGTKAAPVL